MSDNNNADENKQPDTENKDTENENINLEISEDGENNKNSNNSAENKIVKSINKRISEKDLIEKSLEILELSNLDEEIKKKLKLKIHHDEVALLDFDDLDPLDISDDEIEDSCNSHGNFKKISYTQVRDGINKLYYDTSEYYSSAMDILATYVSGQKLIYMESMHYRSGQLNYLMLPAIFLSSVTSVLSVGFDTLSWSKYFLSALSTLR